MEIYETEEEQVAAIKRWWKENGTSTIAGVVAGIVIITGWNFWESNQQEKASKASVLYEQLLTSMQAEDYEASTKISDSIISDYGSTAYATYASLLLAKSKVEQGDLDSAQQIFERLMVEAGTSELRHVARIRLIKLLLAKGEHEKGLQLIAEVDQSSSEGFSASYDELTGDLYVALDRLGEARTAYQSALRAGAKSPLLQLKLDDLTVADIVEKTE